ncbi:MAG: hypothetical protein RJQ09_21120 [Cyclobacteriaceae bacterium]
MIIKRLQKQFLPIGSFFLMWMSVLFLVSCENEPIKKPVPKGPFFGIQPTAEPQLLLPGFIASPITEYNGTFNPDGTEFYYTTNLPNKGVISFTEMLDDSTWSKPAVAQFSGAYVEYDPVFYPSGKRLYFSSRRPMSDTLESNQSNVWFVEKDGSSWKEPQLVPLTDRDNYYNSTTNDGVIYFNTWSNGDMYKATPSGDSFEISRLPDMINSPGDQGDPFISPNEDYIIYRSYGENSLGRGDLFISFQIDGQWTAPANVGAPINSEAHEMCPYVTTDGKLFIFASNRVAEEYETKPLTPLDSLQSKFKTYDNANQNIYYVSAGFIDRMRGELVD